MNALLLLLAACQSPNALPEDLAPPPALLLDLPPLAALEEATLTVTGAPAGAEVVVFSSTADSGAVACPRAMRPVCLDLYAPADVLARGRADARGTFSQTITVPVALVHQTVYAQAVTRVGRRGGVSNVEQEMVLPSWCYGDDGCPMGEHCSVSDGVCNGDPSCPMCDVCTGECVEDTPPPFCYGDDGCPSGQHCTVSDGVCNPDPTCPACTVCTGECVEDLIWCMSSHTCPAGTQCSTEAGECLTPPGCNDPGVVCPAVCYGTCGGGMVR